MFKKLIQYIRDKSGVTANTQRLDKLEAQSLHQHHFLLSWHQLLSPRVLPLNSTLLEKAEEAMQEEFGFTQFNTRVHKNDIMLAYHLYRTAPDVNWGLQSYFRVGARAVARIAEICKKQSLHPGLILDFGSGYGRMSRFLPQVFNAEVIPTEVKAEAIDFQREEMGFQGLVHGVEASEFPGQKVDLIIALSVFTHLPRQASLAWLQKLKQSLKPGGALVFTYHSLEESEHKQHLNKGFHFEKQSEDSLLPISSDYLENTDNYGVSFMSRAFLEAYFRENGWQFQFLDHQLAENQKAFWVYTDGNLQ